jgi:signal transduction histidine kinase
LFVDDNINMRDHITEILSDYAVTAVSDEDAAFSTAYTSLPDIVLADVMIFGKEDFGLMKRLRADARTRTIPVILLSTRAGEKFCIAGLKSGADDYVIEPFSTRELLSCLTINLKLAQMRRSAREDLQRHEMLRQADQRKNEFLATLSHELRNPLAPIRQAAALLKTPGVSDDDAAWARDVISRQVSSMGKLLDDLLDLSRISCGKLELRKEVVDLADVVRSAVETVRPLIDARRHALIIEFPSEAVRIETDPLRLSQIISNLLTNAAKYTDPPRGKFAFGFIEIETILSSL